MCLMLWITYDHITTYGAAQRETDPQEWTAWEGKKPPAALGWNQVCSSHDRRGADRFRNNAAFCSLKAFSESEFMFCSCDHQGSSWSWIILCVTAVLVSVSHQSFSVKGLNSHRGEKVSWSFNFPPNQSEWNERQQVSQLLPTVLSTLC